MQVDFTEAMIGIGKLMAAATHDLKTADPSDVGLGGIPVRAWREAYAEGCRDMANKVSTSLPESMHPEIKQAVMTAFNEEFARLEAATLTSQQEKPHG